MHVDEVLWPPKMNLPRKGTPARKWADMAYRYIRKLEPEQKQNLPLLTLAPSQQKQLMAWQTYFDNHLGYRPMPFRMLLLRSIEAMTLPTDRPWQVDPSYAEPEPVAFD